MLEQEMFDPQLQQLAIHRNRLSICLRQLAILGPAHAPPGLFFDIGDARSNIRRLKHKLRALGVTVEEHIDDEPAPSESMQRRAVPRQAPPPPRHYVDRLAPTDALREALLSDDDKPLIMLHGMPGAGKSSLAAHVVRALDEDIFPDGVLWGNLDNLTPNDLLLSFMAAWDSSWYHSPARTSGSLRKLFWQTLADTNACALIVLDNVREARQIIELLPPTLTRIGRCRVLAISPRLHKSLPINYHDLSLGYFSEAEALHLFRQHIGEEKCKLYADKLRDISRRLEYVPQQLVAAAHDFATGKILPTTYLLMLRQGEGQSKLIGSAVRDSLELTLRDMTPEQVVLFELVGVMGEGDWRDSMLAAIALRSISETRHDLVALSDYEFVLPSGNHRYRVNTAIREYARQRFQQRPAYVREAASTMLARYCLDTAQDLVASLRARPDLRLVLGRPAEPTDKEFVHVFREGLLLEMSHIRQILRWAVEVQAWDILLRFSYVSAMELLDQFVANAFAIRMSLFMATLVEPIIWLEGEKQLLRCNSLIVSTSWTYNSASTSITTVDPHVTAVALHDERAAPPTPKERCELSLDIIAGHVVDGVFDTASLADVRWAGVRSSGLLCREVDFVGGQFFACDLSYSVFVHCDARRTTLLGSNMSYVLLNGVKLQGAILQGINLTGAVLEHVDLRGADLRGANLTGAVLEHVDLRSADLREANLTGAILTDVNASGADLRGADCSLIRATKLILVECRIAQARWAGATTDEVVFEDASFVKELEIAAQEMPSADANTFIYGWRPVHEIIQPAVRSFANADLRGVDLAGRNLARRDLRGTDLRLAMLAGTKLSDANLDKATLRAACLEGAFLDGASLRGVDLYAAILKRASLERADLSRAVLRAARLEHAKLANTNMSAAMCRSACLDYADLHMAVLDESDLTNASLKSAQLTRASLRGANLTGADLTDTDLTGTDLTNAICDGTRFVGAKVAPAQLACVQSLRSAIMPDEQVSLVLDSFYGVESIPGQSPQQWLRNISQPNETIHLQGVLPDMLLRFAECSGDFAHISLARRDLLGARLSGRFRTVEATAADLTDAVLSGNFSYTKLAEAKLVRATLSGTFFDVIFCWADFQGANLQGASLVNIDLQYAQHLNDDQLRQAARLRGSVLPDGSRYDNRFNLPGDRDDALHARVDPNDPVAMAHFCANTKPRGFGKS